MAVHLSVLLILTGLTGIHSVTTVSEVSVQAGKSISIPCLYGSQYVNNVKYLCEGYYWSSCSYAAKTNQPHSSGKFSISDDKNQRIFTATIKQLTNGDTNFWCNVEINGGTDVGQYFHLSVTSGTPSLYVDRQEIRGFHGENITIKCHSKSGEMRWCRLGRSCVTGLSGSLDGTAVTIDTSVPNVFTVTMSGLRPESSGWYWCATGDFQMPVHVNVTDKPTTTTPTTVTEDGEDKNGQYSASVDLQSLIISLGLLVLIVIVTLFIWLVLRRKQAKAESSPKTMANEEATCCDVKHKRNPSGQAEEELTYSNVVHVRKNSAQSRDVASDVDVTYSSVVTMKEQSVKRGEAKDMDVTYSTLAYHH